MTSNLLLSAEVARRLGIRTQTLAKWRMEGKGPKGWIYLSATRVAYPEEEVDVFIRTLADRRPIFNFQKTNEPKIAANNRVIE
jgi:predicted site-specific integrase-resolvase